MAVAAETKTLSQTYVDQEVALLEQQFPNAITLPETVGDTAIRERAANFIGICVADRTVSFSPEVTQPIESLYDAIQKAETDPQARKLVETNVRTDVIERTIKTGHVIKVTLDVDEAGRIQQFGQSMESVQANSLRYAANSWQMRERTEAETTNAFRIEQLYKEGILDDYAFVVFSRAADNMSHKDMVETGFFVETMSTAIQVTTAENGQLSTESAFVSGISKPGRERHDAQTLERVGEHFGVDYANKTAAEVLATPMLVHKNYIQNGVIDIVKIWDDAVDGSAFFGEDRQREDYQVYRKKCQEREQMLQPKVEAITHDIVSEAASIRDRVHATQRLAKLSEQHMLEQAVFDRSIDARVFGADALRFIEESRRAFENGDLDAGMDALNQASKVAKSSSCPGGSEGERGSTVELGDCTFVSKECPLCHKKNVLTTVKTDKTTKLRTISGSCNCSVTSKVKD